MVGPTIFMARRIHLPLGERSRPKILWFLSTSSSTSGDCCIRQNIWNHRDDLGEHHYRFSIRDAEVHISFIFA
jgi:hypothetical protein